MSKIINLEERRINRLNSIFNRLENIINDLSETVVNNKIKLKKHSKELTDEEISTMNLLNHKLFEITKSAEKFKDRVSKAIKRRIN